MNIILKNLPFDVDQNAIVSWLQSEALDFREVRLARERETGRSRGFAFIETETEEQGLRIMERFDGAPLGNRHIICELAREAMHSPRSQHQLILRGLPTNVTQPELKAAILDEGVEFTHCRLCVDRELGTSLGYGFLHFGSAEYRDAALTKLQGLHLYGQRVRCDIPWDNDRDKKPKLEAQPAPINYRKDDRNIIGPMLEPRFRRLTKYSPARYTYALA